MGSIKMDKFFFKAYGNLAAVYQTIGDNKKSEKTLIRLASAQNAFAEKDFLKWIHSKSKKQ